MKSKTTENKTYWLEHIASYKASGLSKSRYCLQATVCYHRFLYWFDKLAKQAAQINCGAKTEQFIPIKLAPISESKSAEFLCVLELKQGHRLLIHNVVVLEKLISILSK